MSEKRVRIKGCIANIRPPLTTVRLRPRARKILEIVQANEKAVGREVSLSVLIEQFADWGLATYKQRRIIPRATASGTRPAYEAAPEEQ